MANEIENKRTITIPNEEKLVFSYRADKDVAKDGAKEVTVLVDLSKLTDSDILEWAFSSMVVSYQGKLRSKNPPKAEEDGSYRWSVPSRGSRTVADPAKIAEAANKLVDKMGEEQKKELLYHTLVSMGKSAAEATAISGFTPAKK